MRRQTNRRCDNACTRDCHCPHCIPTCPTGPTGMAGVTGATGPCCTGPTGATGPSGGFAPANLSIYAAVQEPLSVAVGDDVPFNVDAIPVVAAEFTRTASVITITQSGTYELIFGLSTATGGTRIAAFLNGSPLQGTLYERPALVGDTDLFTLAIMFVAVAGATLSIHNVGPNTLSLTPAGSGVTQAYLTLKRVR